MVQTFTVFEDDPTSVKKIKLHSAMQDSVTKIRTEKNSSGASSGIFVKSSFAPAKNLPIYSILVRGSAYSYV